MLALKSVRKPVQLARRATAANGSTVPEVSIFVKTLSTSTGTANIPTMGSAGKCQLGATWTLISIKRSQNVIMLPQLAMMSARFNTNQPRRPTPPSLPDKQQLEKYFFRTLAFLWDTSYWLFTLARENFNKHIMDNPSVQLYVKKIHEKMEKSKKN